MRPGHVRVFDGLRITTEHMDHLQGSLHSALQEIREILGLGRVYFGFEVVAEGEHAITVQPGLAFDYAGNRLAFDEPKTLEVAFEPDEDTKFVCLKYDQIEDGQVEGHFTLIWDSCSIALRATVPGVKENLVPIARLVKSEDGAFEIVSLVSKEQTEEAIETPAEAEGPHTEEIKEASESAIEDATATEGVGETDTDLTEEPSGRKEGEAGVLTEAAPSRKPWRLRVQQNIARLTADTGAGNYLNAVILEPLKRKLSSRDASDGGEMLFNLAEKEVALDFPVSSLNCHTIISAAVSVTEKPTSEGVQPQSAELKCQSTAQGEATFADDGISQFGVSTIQAYANDGAGSALWSSSELTERGIAHLPLGALSKVSGNENGETVWDILRHLQLLLRVERTDASRFKVICSLLWKGGISNEIIQQIENIKAGFTWETLVAWKALGESSE